jgi:NodT family efflux transporter outer membrane factor (OMF) lipoprotein
VGPNYHAPRNDAPGAFAAESPSITASDPVTSGASATRADADLSQWWHALHDAELDSLVDRAIKANPDIEIALTRLQEVRTEQAVLVGDALPNVSAGGFSGRGTGSDLTKAGAAPALRAGDNKGNLAQIREIGGFSASWEIDLFGGYRRAIEAGRFEIQAAAWARSAVLTSVVADVASNYLQLRGLQMRLTVLQQNVLAAQQFHDFEQQRFDLGFANELDLQLAERELARLQSQLPAIESGIDRAQYRLASLLGLYPEELSPELAAPGELPPLPAAVRTGVPVELLKRRPDIRAAERQLAASTARIGIATANLFPHLTLTGAAGAQSASNTWQGSHLWAFGPSVYWPLLDFGALDAAVNVADLQAHEQLIKYRQTVIAAVADADGAISTYSADQRQVQSLSLAIDASLRAVDLAEQRYDRGLSDFLNVIDARRQQYSLEDEYISAQQQAAESFVALYKALGGGWQAFQNVPPIRHALPAVLAGPERLLSDNDPQK